MIIWIIGLCVTATLAIVGWTVAATLAARMRKLETIEKAAVELQGAVTANNIRISVLENKYDTIQAALIEIKTLLQRHVNGDRESRTRRKG